MKPDIETNLKNTALKENRKLVQIPLYKIFPLIKFTLSPQITIKKLVLMEIQDTARFMFKGLIQQM